MLKIDKIDDKKYLVTNEQIPDKKNSKNQELLFDICTIDWEFVFILHPLREFTKASLGIICKRFSLSIRIDTFFKSEKEFRPRVLILLLRSCKIVSDEEDWDNFVRDVQYAQVIPLRKSIPVDNGHNLPDCTCCSQTNTIAGHFARSATYV
ncbi:hypothetical protein GQR58_014201 [Nymphon striatum]|nr:hypothetical protein GQR58_014201 [Nymphon striatum]